MLISGPNLPTISSGFKGLKGFLTLNLFKVSSRVKNHHFLDD